MKSMKSVTQFKTSQGKGELICNKNRPLISRHSTEKAFPPPPTNTHTHHRYTERKENSMMRSEANMCFKGTQFHDKKYMSSSTVFHNYIILL